MDLPPSESYKTQEFFSGKTNQLLLPGNCLDQMKLLPSRSVHLIATDLPYGTTQNRWDTVIPFEPLWQQYKRILIERGVIVLTAAQPFTSMLVMSNLKMFKYDLVWEKTIASGQLNVKRQPLRNHESILVFYDKPGTYNEQKTVGEPYSIKRTITFKGEGYGKQQNSEKTNDGFRHAKSVMRFSNPRIKNGHPTEKPVSLMEHIVKTYSNKNDVVLDSCMGFGSTGVACKNLNRRFIGIELDPNCFASAENKLNA